MTRLLLFSDSHQNAVLDSAAALLDKRIFGFLNFALKRRFQHHNEYLENAVQYALQSKPDAVIFTGDAVCTAAPAEFKSATRFFHPLKNAGIPLICVQGNHDCYVSDPLCRNAMLEFYSDLTPHFSEHPFLLQFRDVRLAVIPEAKPTPPWLSCGFLSDESVEFIIAEANKKSDSPLILVGHFPLLDNSWRRGLRNREKTLPLLQSGKIHLSFCGHVHRPSESLDETGRGEIIAGSITKYGILTEISFLPEQNIFRHQRISVKNLPNP